MKYVAIKWHTFSQISATMETSGWWEEPLCMRDEWSCAGMRPGAPSVMNTGPLMVPMWPADNWDSWILVMYFTSRYTTMFQNTFNYYVNITTGAVAYSNALTSSHWP